MVTDLNRWTDKNTIIIIGDFDTYWRSSTHKINKKTLTLNHTSDQMCLKDIYRTFHPTTEYTFFSCAHETFPIIYHMVGHQKKPKNKQTKTKTKNKKIWANLKTLKAYQVTFPTTVVWKYKSLTEGMLDN